MKAIVWRLPGGAGGMAALNKQNIIRKELISWIAQHQIDSSSMVTRPISSWHNIQGYFYMLTMTEKYATIFALSWQGEPYAYFEDYMAL